MICNWLYLQLLHNVYISFNVKTCLASFASHKFHFCCDTFSVPFTNCLRLTIIFKNRVLREFCKFSILCISVLNQIQKGLLLYPFLLDMIQIAKKVKKMDLLYYFVVYKNFTYFQISLYESHIYFILLFIHFLVYFFIFRYCISPGFFRCFRILVPLFFCSLVVLFLPFLIPSAILYFIDVFYFIFSLVSFWFFCSLVLYFSRSWYPWRFFISSVDLIYCQQAGQLVS